jgi:ribosomal protein S18 acetylase RimI-like enzyme
MTDTILVPDAPDISGLTFRRFRGESDFPVMVDIANRSKEADGVEFTYTLEDKVNYYRYLSTFDAYQDMLFAEMDGGEVIGFGRTWWRQELDGAYLHLFLVRLLPEWREQGIRRAMLRYLERRARQIAAEHPPDTPVILGGWAADTERDWRRVLESAGYEPVRYEFFLLRPDLEDIPALPLPEGVEVRPAQPEHYYRVWKASEEAFQDHWGACAWPDEWFEEWIQEPIFSPELWQVAWDGDEVAGMVLNYISQEENEEYGRARGYTEDIGVRRPWRRRGLARALLARSLRVLKDQGMTEAHLSVDAQNPRGALQLYESLGFRRYKESARYRKALKR